MLLRPLPVKNPAELVALSHDGPIYGMNIGAGAFSHPMYRDLEQQNHVLAGLVASFATTVNLAYAGAVERAEVQLVSGNYFEVLGVGTVLGRPLTRADRPSAIFAVNDQIAAAQARFGLRREVDDLRGLCCLRRS